MSARRKERATSTTSASRSDLKAEVPLQALVLADSFQRRFTPLTLKQPKALLPLVNLPLISYALHFLHRAGVHEAFVIVGSFPAMIREHCQQLRASLLSMRVTMIMVNDSCMSVGDVFRHVHHLEIIRSDPFIFMGADTVADIDMAPIIAAHRKRSSEDPEAIMTLILKPARPFHRIRSDGDNLVVALSSPSQKLLAYSNPSSRRAKITSDVDIMIDNSSVTFHTNMLNTFIYVCSPSVLSIFNDQFDMQTIEGDFLAQILGSSSIMGSSAFAHIVHDQYAARVDCLKTYDAVSRDIIERWAFRFAIDGDGPGPSYSSQRLNIYKELGSGVVQAPRIAQSALIKRNSVIGAGSVVGNRAHLEDTILDRHVLIGDDVYCTGSYIWSESTIGDRTVIDRAIIARNVHIASDVYIGRGVVIGKGVRVGRGIQVPPYTALWVPDQNRGSVVSDLIIDDGVDRLRIGLDASPYSTLAVMTLDLGSGGVGSVYIRDDDDDGLVPMEDDEEHDQPAAKIDLLRLARISSNTLAPDKAALDVRDERLAELNYDDDDIDSVMTFDSDIGGNESDVAVDASTWDEEEYCFNVLYREIKATIDRCREQNIADKGDILLEVANLKIADNASLTTYASCVLLSIFDLIEPVPASDMEPSLSMLKALSRLLREYNFLLEKYGQGSDENHLLFLHGLVKACTYDDKPYRSIFPFALKALYQLDAISGEAIVEWAALDHSTNPEHMLLLESTSELLDFLRDDDENDDDSSSGDD